VAAAISTLVAVFPGGAAVPIDEAKIAQNVTVLAMAFKLASVSMDIDSVGAALAFLVADYVTCFPVEVQQEMHALFDRVVTSEIEQSNAEGCEVEH
jgi:hypothetical protein